VIWNYIFSLCGYSFSILTSNEKVHPEEPEKFLDMTVIEWKSKYFKMNHDQNHLQFSDKKMTNKCQQQYCKPFSQGSTIWDWDQLFCPHGKKTNEPPHNFPVLETDRSRTSAITTSAALFMNLQEPRMEIKLKRHHI